MFGIRKIIRMLEEQNRLLKQVAEHTSATEPKKIDLSGFFSKPQTEPTVQQLAGMTRNKREQWLSRMSPEIREQWDRYYSEVLTNKLTSRKSHQ